MIIAAVIVGGYIIYGQLFGSSDAQISYRTAPIATGQLREVVTTSGSVNAVVTVEVGSQLSGQIAELKADFNDAVSKGQVLAVIDQQSYQARLSEATATLAMAQATIDVRKAEFERAEQDLLEVKAGEEVLKARLDTARAQLVVADADLGRKTELRAGGNAPVRDLDQARAEQRVAAAEFREAKANLSTHAIKVAAAGADVARADAQLKNAMASYPEQEALKTLAEIELERTTIRSPIDGVVIGRDIDEGQTVAASLEAPTLFTIAQDLSEMEVHARIDETDIGKIRLGQTTTFTVDAYPERSFAGEVVQIRKAPQVIQNVVTYTVVIRAKNDELLLLPGMTALVRVIVMESAPSLLAPTAALLFKPSEGGGEEVPASTDGDGDGEGAIVWRLDDRGRPQAVAVTPGETDGQNTVVLSGEVAQGDEVIVGEVIQPSSSQIFGIRLGF